MNRAERRADEAHGRQIAAQFRHQVTARVRANKRLTLAGQAETRIEQAYDRDAVGDRASAGVTPDRIPCRPGCAACCEQVVFVTELEARAIIAHYPDVIADVVRDLPTREGWLHDTCEQAGIPIDVFDFMADSARPEQKAQRGVVLDHWYARRIPCAFLDTKTRRCRVYEHRPVSCRDHVLIDEPPTVCDDRSGVPALAFMTRAAGTAMTEQMQGAKALDLPPRIGVMTTMLIQILLEEKVI